MLTCACGTRFEVDDTLAGQEVLCPECQQPLQAPVGERPPLITSNWALASVLLALIGAFTVVGTLTAVVFGLIALASIARNRRRVAGTGFAVLGICLGVLFTVLTVVALNAADLFGLESWLRERTMLQKVDTSGPLEVVQGFNGFAITRPSEKWGQVQDNQSDDAAVDSFQNNLDLLWMQIGHHAFIDVRTMPAGAFQTLDQCETELLAEFDTQRRANNPFDNDDDFDRRPARPAKRLGGRRLDAKDGTEGREMEVEVRCGGKPWHFLIRLYRRGNGTVYIVRAYAPENRFKVIRSELQSALDSFRILKR